MKKIVIFILSIFLIFSSQNVFAKETQTIDELLNLEYGPFELDLKLDKLDTYNFSNSNIKKVYNKMVKYDKIVRKDIIQKSKEGKYDYYETSDIVKSYKSFVYYTNQFFYLLSLSDKNKNLEKDLSYQDSLLQSYQKTSTYFYKVKNLIVK